jgi:hypothetical protein
MVLFDFCLHRLPVQTRHLNSSSYKRWVRVEVLYIPEDCSALTLIRSNNIPSIMLVPAKNKFRPCKIRIKTVISGRGFLGLPQSGISAHVYSEPSAVSSFNSLYGREYATESIETGPLWLRRGSREASTTSNCQHLCKRIANIE